MADKLAHSAGYDSVPWFPLTVQLIYIYTVLTMFVMFLRPDFLNLTICLTALFMLNNIALISKGKFKVLVFAVFISLIYDVIWFYIKHAEYADGADGSSEIGIRKFSLLMSYSSFLLRVIVVHL